MTSTMTRERMLMPPSNELDSEGSSGGGVDHQLPDNHHRVDLRRHLHTDDILDSSSPKKRRKQMTPVRVTTTLITTGEQMASEEDDDDTYHDGLEEEEMEDLEGEIATTAHDNHHTDRESEDEFIEKGKTTLVREQAISKDENLNTEFQCSFCGNLFEDKDTLLRHKENEHDTANLTTQSINLSPLSQNLLLPVGVKIEQQDESSDNPVNLSSGFSLKTFTNSWLTGTTTPTTQLQDSEWSNQNPMLIPGHMSYPGALTQYLPLPTFPINETGQLTRNVVGGSGPVRIFNPDAYCQLCNKEFCNKYFLKTHKANKHGIYMDPPASNTPNANDNNGLMSYPNSIYPPANIKLEQPQSQPPQQQKLEIPEISPVLMIPTIPCDICQKRFKNEESLKKHKQKVHIEQISDHTDSQSLPATGLGEDDCRDLSSSRLDSSPNNIEALFKQEFGIEQEDAKYMPPPRQFSPQLCQQIGECGFTADKLRSIGIINPDAFCEICYKEYCNKHFLRIHKIKRHNILIGSNGKSPNNPEAAASWHQIQTSPLNLIVSDNPTSSESTDKSDDCECKTCGIRFQTIDLYETHKNNNHENQEHKSPTRPTMDMEELDIEQQRSDTISQDLQKLQTMILQLNGLKPNNRPIICSICSRECESQLALKTHMSLEHGTTILEESLSPSQQLVENSFSTASSTFCTLCEKDFRSPDTLKQHLADDHNHHQTTPTPNNLTHVPLISTSAPTNQLPPAPPLPPPADKKITSMTPTSSYCEICNKELCNKYFMKTHMQRMHGIEIENGSQIGGVVCNICNKELCSKYFLRVHKHNTHGIIDEGTVSGGSTTNIKPDNFESSNSEDMAALKSSDQLGDLSHRYFTHFTEVCPVCSRRFRSIKWLKAHLLGDHGKIGIDKWRDLEQQYQQNTTAAKKLPTNQLINRPIQPSPNLKIPNGFDVTHHLKSTTNDHGATTIGNQVLSTLFGGAEEQNKNYRCSYCNFTTPVLPFLFLHERSHVTSDNINLEQNAQCPICSQGFTQPEMLHHHLVTRHQFSGMQFPSPIITTPTTTVAATNLSVEANQIEHQVTEKKEKSDITDNNIQCQIYPVQSNSETIKNKIDDTNSTSGAVATTTATGTILVTPQAAYKCAQCGLATANLNRIKKHVKKDHKSIGDPTDNVIAELTKTLRDVANKHKVPVSYAIPQDTNSNPDTATIMQPFIVKEKDCGFSSDDCRVEKKFSPVLIYLPVRTRVTDALTTSFTLVPT
ncbi:uncharacterized protein LOC103575866 [Microplitis demolitor]|uniref:uncharacterized protein LOC103575866 n=1 Tax=Microplitis demolitor TaxID=69319 RepID=UPI0004CD1018|nr:uncharacterized protein LOC103575866 [Microplitis demolitor]